MSFLDHVTAVVTPTVSDECRAVARRKIEELAACEPEIKAIVDQHKEIEASFNVAHSAPSAGAVERIAKLLTGHAIAVGTSVYSEVADDSSATHTTVVREDHAIIKIQLAKLSDIPIETDEWNEELGRIEAAIAQIIYQEENSWLPDLAMWAHRKTRLLQPYIEAFGRSERTMGTGKPSGASFIPEQNVTGTLHA